MRLLCEQDVERLIDPALAIASAAAAYRRQASGKEPAPGRLDLPRQAPTGNVLVLAGHGPDGLFCSKNNVHAYPDAGSRQRNSASMLVLWDAIRCRPLALLAATGFNNHRTAAGLAAAADKLAAGDVKTLTIFGAGKIAPAAIRYLHAVRPFERILILGRGLVRATALAETLKREPAFAQVDIGAGGDIAEATREADVIVTLTTAAEPVFFGRDVKPGTLVILAGANKPQSREADDVLIARGTVHVDHRDGCLTRAGDLAIPLASGVLKPQQIAGEIGQLFADNPPVQAACDVTVFKSIGTIAQDIALAHALYRRALERGVGLDFDAVTGETPALAAVERAAS
ncbi:MAG TPA: ornithine cyclodeaminase family protein [Xanthobacteraceae bacterium]|jgi:ornithine cyclodeaminase/alanine dehydrogenase-like protein (mu-crystallin family)|nr:ornithine cyclodeaminase family protein [Xanthobacteraceae bacterium]